MEEISRYTLKVAEVAQLLGVGERTVRRLTHEGQIPHIRIGKLIKFTREGLEEYLRVSQEQSVEPEDDYSSLPAHVGGRRIQWRRGGMHPVRI